MKVGGNYRGRQEEYGYPEGPHSKGLLGRNEGGDLIVIKGIFGSTFQCRERDSGFQQCALWRCVHMCILTYMYVCQILHCGFLLMLLNMRIKYCFYRALCNL